MDISEIIGAIAKAANAQFVMRDTDEVGPDGMVFCRVCGRHRQAKLGDALVPALCDCDKAKIEREKARRERQRISDIVHNSVLYDRVYSGITFENDQYPKSRASAVMRSYASEWDKMKKQNQGVLLWGPPGSGKTYYASCTVNALRKNGVCAQICNMPRLLMALDTWDKSEIIDAVKTVPLLALDDIGSERGSEFQLEKAFALIDARVQAQKPMICTSNITVDEMKNTDDLNRQRIYSRVLGACAVRILVDDGDKRAAEAQGKVKDARRVLLGKEG